MKYDGLIRDFQDIRTKMEDSDRICHLLLALPSTYNSVIVTLEKRQPMILLCTFFYNM